MEAPYGWIFFGNFDLALVSLYLFWIFFAGLIWYIQRENMREGYPLENEDGSHANSLLPVPGVKTFQLPQGGEVQAPDLKREVRELALARTAVNGGFPFAPTGDPMADGVGPASYAMRRDEPELDGHGNPKIRPMAVVGDFAVAAGRDPRGLPVKANDRQSPGTVSDMWVDVPEQLVRYLEVTLADGSKRLIPMGMARIKADHVAVRALDADRFAGVPRAKAGDVVTKLEEDMISGFYGGGTLYAQDKKGSRRKALSELF
ncbi:photosynthetic reaction center subunit H [Pararhodobacter sp. SW119]|uniref:photosynthetic reaction center subunit H n=1 Tax=Pararhodobacter sp. SW119 TaxID=2780075 RepID=UPI001ADFA677|nr:photosynthetic reaction center subunit H [Pararhodobacter sp. SW119]